MPQVQVVDTTERPPEPTGVEQFFSRLGKSYKDESDRVEIGKLIDEYKTNREDANAWENLQLGLEKSNISPTKRLQTQASLNEMKKLIIEKDKALNAKVNKGILTQEEKERQRGNLIKAGWPEYAADVYLDAPPGVKQTLEREHAALTERGLRKPLVSVPAGVDNQQAPSSEAVAVPDASAPSGEKPVFVDDQETPQEKRAAKSAKPIPEEEWPAPIQPNNLTQAERVKWENNNEKENNKELKATAEKKKAFRTNDNLINSMTQVNDGKYLPDGLSKLIIVDPESGDIRPTAQLLKIQNPQTELYVKNLKQWLKGAKDFFGARVTNFDVSSFMQQLPSLLNSEQGRRLILKQMKYVNDLESIHNNTLNEALKKYGRTANYSQITGVVDQKVAEKEEDLMGKINNLVLASKDIQLMSENQDKFRNHVLMQKPDGSFRAVPKDRVEFLKKEKKWRDF
jgi:hypothetical protein